MAILCKKTNGKIIKIKERKYGRFMSTCYLSQSDLCVEIEPEMKSDMKKKGTVLLSLVTGLVSGMGSMGYFKNKELAEKDKKIEKFRSYYNLLNQWIINNHAGKSLEQYFIDHNYHTIAIYGMGEIGNRFYEQIKESDKIEVKYAIDQEASYISGMLKVYDPDETEFPEVDVVVVTALFAYDEIAKMLNAKKFLTISLEDIIYSVR